MKHTHFKHLTLLSFIIVLVIVIVDTAICATKDINRKSQNISSVVNTETNNKNKSRKDKASEKIKKQNMINSSRQFLESYTIYKKDDNKISPYNRKLSSRQDDSSQKIHNFNQHSYLTSAR